MQAMLDLIEMGDRVPSSFMTAVSLPSFVPPTRWADDAYIETAVALSGQLVGGVSQGLAGQMHADISWAGEDHLEELANLDAPALAIAAEFDTGFPPALVMQAVARMPHGEFVEIKGSAHVSLDPAHAEQLRTAISDFLARHAPPS
jgi:pimeloyl-ACP methyl ester carboxylesterase